MAVGYQQLETLHPIPGIRIATVEAGVRYPNRRDLVLFELASESSVAAMFTQNQFCAAPVQIAKRHLGSTSPRYLLINTGNANAGTGEQGLHDAIKCCQSVAEQFSVMTEAVIPFSTGVIGEMLPVDPIVAALPRLQQGLSEEGWADAAHGIMTTDTIAKGLSCTIELSSGVVTLTAIAKGSGMIHPNMATMLSYLATDAEIDPVELQEMLREAVKLSFNRISVDGDTSTNDAVVMVATGHSKVSLFKKSGDGKKFQSTLNLSLQRLAQMMIRDAEGATKFVTIKLTGLQNEAEGEQIAFTIAHSPLVKTALFASDPNWGRILAAIGRAGVTDLDINHIDITLNGVAIVESGGRAASYTEEAGQEVMNMDEITIAIELHRGDGEVNVWTSDLSHDYVRINAEYRT